VPSLLDGDGLGPGVASTLGCSDGSPDGVGSTDGTEEGDGSGPVLGLGAVSVGLGDVSVPAKVGGEVGGKIASGLVGACGGGLKVGGVGARVGCGTARSTVASAPTRSSPPPTPGCSAVPAGAAVGLWKLGSTGLAEATAPRTTAIAQATISSGAS
jgi:hypothetical protein